MVKEAYRVLRNNGKIGVSVWGRIENSEYVTLFNEAVKKAQIQTTQSTVRSSNFKLSDRNNLIQLFKNEGFSNIQCWYQYSPAGGEDSAE